MDLHRLLAAYNLDCDFLPDFACVRLKNTRSDDVRKHAFAKRREDLVPPSVKLLSENDLVITLGIGSRIECSGDNGRCRRFLQHKRHTMSF